MWPMEDSTMKSGPRKAAMVFALAGDSTMTRDLSLTGSDRRGAGRHGYNRIAQAVNLGPNPPRGTDRATHWSVRVSGGPCSRQQIEQDASHGKWQPGTYQLHPTINVHVLEGRKPGPTALVQAGIHGDEIAGVHAL